MRKCTAFILMTLILTGCFYISAVAAPLKTECEDAWELSGGANVQSSEFASEEELIGLKPEEIGTDAIAEYKINITEDGKYAFVFTYSAAAGDGMVRRVDMSMDDVRLALDMKQTESWEVFETVSLTLELTAGEHNLKLLSPSDYDNSAVKTPNMDFFTYEKIGDLPQAVGTIVVEESAEAVDVPSVEVEEAIEPISEPAPMTSDTGIIVFILLSVVSGIVLVRSKLGKGKI